MIPSTMSSSVTHWTKKGSFRIPLFTLWPSGLERSKINYHFPGWCFFRMTTKGLIWLSTLMGETLWGDQWLQHEPEGTQFRSTKIAHWKRNASLSFPFAALNTTPGGENNVTVLSTLLTQEAAAMDMATEHSTPAAFAARQSERPRSLNLVAGLKGTTNLRVITITTLTWRYPPRPNGQRHVHLFQERQ